MVEELMVCVDRIILASSSSSSSSAAAPFCFDSSVNNISSNSQGERLLSTVNTIQNPDATTVEVLMTQKSGKSNGENGDGNSKEKKGVLRECRICQEEDEELDMEAPCACNGTLKFAHRKCIQRWCNKKGDITCEICNQVFSPNYILQPKRSDADVMAIDIRQAWGSNFDPRDPHFLAYAAAEREFFQSEYEEYIVPNSDASLANKTCLTGHKGFWNGPRDLYLLPFSNIISSAGWFSSSLLCDGPLMVHYAMSQEETGLDQIMEASQFWNFEEDVFLY